MNIYSRFCFLEEGLHIIALITNASGRLGREGSFKSAAGLRPLFLGFNIQDFKEFKTSL